MARIFQDGFEMGRPAPHGTTVFGAYRDSLWQYNQNEASSWSSSVGVSATVKNSGEYSLRLYHSAVSGVLLYIQQLFRNLGQNLTEHYDRVEFRVDNFQTGHAAQSVYHWRDENFDVVASIRIDENNTLRMFVGDTEVGTIAGAITGGVFHRIEAHYLVDDTSGLFEVRVDGNSLFSWGGDTDPLETGHIRFLCLGKIASSATDITFYYDDIAVNDTVDDGSGNNSWCGKGSILLLKPKGAGNHSDFTPSNGADNWDNVNEIPHDGDTTYVEGDTAGDKDSYEMESLVADKGVDPGAVVKAVQACFTARYEGSDANLAALLRLGTEDEEGDAKYLANTYHRVYDQVFSVSPFDDQQWDIADVDNMEAGVTYKEHQHG